MIEDLDIFIPKIERFRQQLSEAEVEDIGGLHRWQNEPQKHCHKRSNLPLVVCADTQTLDGSDDDSNLE